MPEEKAKTTRIEKVSWGTITVNGQRFGQVIISRDRVEERNREKLEKLFGTTHQIGDWEIEALLAGNPEVIIIGNGQGEVLRISSEVQEKLTRSGAEIKVLRTPVAMAEFNKLASTGKRVNALIHTTC